MRSRALAVAVLLTVATPLVAQFKNGNQTVILDLPRASPRCVLTQRIALTNWYGLARVQVAQGDRTAAKASLESALAQAKRPGPQRHVQRLLGRLAAGQAID